VPASDAIPRRNPCAGSSIRGRYRREGRRPRRVEARCVDTYNLRLDEVLAPASYSGGDGFSRQNAGDKDDAAINPCQAPAGIDDVGDF